MQTICIVLIVLGACLLLYSIILFYQGLVFLKLKAYEQRVFSNWSYLACLALMVFFLAGYLGTAFFYLSWPYNANHFLVALIFFFGALFVLMMVTMQRRMSSTIFSKTGELVRTLVNAVEAKDTYTRGHSDHVLNLVRIFYSKLPQQMQGQIHLSRLMDAAILHDIGKIGTDDSILNKPGPLTESEWVIVRRHPLLGRKILENTSYSAIGAIIYCHHERVDGQGYYGIPAEQIPLEAKIIAIADTFSAIYTDRIYRKSQSHARAVELLREAAGNQLDAELVEIFCSIPQNELDMAGYVFSEQVSYIGKKGPQCNNNNPRSAVQEDRG